MNKDSNPSTPSHSTQHHRRDYKHTWYKANRKRTVHNIIDEYIRFVEEDGDIMDKHTPPRLS